MKRFMRMRGHRWWLIAVASLTAAAVTAGCGSSNKAASGTSKAAATSSAGTTSTGAESSSTSAAAASGVPANLAAQVATLEKAPTKLALTTPLPKAPPKGTMIWMNCDVPACTIIGDGVKAGVEAAGWTFKEINYVSANPATLTSALTQALAQHPTAVTLSGIPPTDGWSSVIPAYKKAGIPIIPTFLGPTPLTSTVVANPGGPADRYQDGVNMAKWFIVDSKGKGIALLQRLDGFPILAQWANGFQATVSKDCKACKITTLKSTIADATGGSIPGTIVPALESNPSATYMISADLEFLDGLPSLMKAANLTGKVKVAGATPDLTGEKLIENGTWTAATPQKDTLGGELAADVAFREAEHIPIPKADDGPITSQILLKGGPWTPAQSFTIPNYQAQLDKLWKVK